MEAEEFDYAVTSSNRVTEGSLSRGVTNLAKALARKHGDVHISVEEHGVHLNMASPEALQRDGSRELTARHLAVNADKYVGEGQWASRQGKYNPEFSAYCMKYSVKYTVSALLNWVPLHRRGFKASSNVTVGSTKRRLIDDGRGNMIPDHPGDVLPITSLPADHPAAWYLTSRGYDLGNLWERFRTSYCYKELHGGFRELRGCMRDTPQGRPIFYCDIDTVQVGWQARIIEQWVGDIHMVWHPYKSSWVKTRIGRGSDCVWSPGFEPFEDLAWDPAKYKTAPGSSRNQILMGVDSALSWNDENRPGLIPTCVLVEGPLDAARFGAGVAMLGKYLSENQSSVLRKKFQKFVYIPDNDAAGRKSTKRVSEMLAGSSLRVVALPSDIKDIGEMSYTESEDFIKPFMK